MTNDPLFRNQTQEIEHLRKEIQELKDIAREILSRLTQIERHADRAFPSKPVKGALSKSLATASAKAGSVPTISSGEALTLFSELTQLSKEQGGEAAERKLAGFATPDLILIAHELGVVFKSKPSRRDLYNRILGRINESMMLSRNTNVTKPLSTIARMGEDESTSPANQRGKGNRV